MHHMRCWYRGCDKPGDSRPIFAQVHSLPGAMKLCDRHMSELAREPDMVSTAIERPDTTAVDWRRPRA